MIVNLGHIKCRVIFANEQYILAEVLKDKIVKNQLTDTWNLRALFDKIPFYHSDLMTPQKASLLLISKTEKRLQEIEGPSYADLRDYGGGNVYQDHTMLAGLGKKMRTNHFMTGSLKNGEVELFPNTAYKMIAHSEKSFELQPKEPNFNDGDTVVFSSPYETIYISESLLLHSEDEWGEYLSTRLNVNSFRFTRYWVYKINNRDKGARYFPYTQFGVMTIQGLMNFFGSQTRRGTKIETLQECLDSVYISDYPGKQYIVRVSRHRNSEINKLLPTDFVLSRAARFRVLSSYECLGKHFFLVEQDDESGDFSHSLYALMEEWGSASDIHMDACEMKDVEKAIVSMEDE